MAIRQDEPIAIPPTGIGWVVLQVVVPNDFGDIGHPHRHAGMAGIRLLYGIHGQGANGIGEFTSTGHHYSLVIHGRGALPPG